MRLLSISEKGITPVTARRHFSDKFQHYFYSVSAGEIGNEECWQVRLPIPVDEIIPNSEALNTETIDFKLTDLNKVDAQNQGCYMLTLGRHDGKFLVILKTLRLDTVSISNGIGIVPAAGHGIRHKYLLLLVGPNTRLKVVRNGFMPKGEPKQYGVLFNEEGYQFVEGEPS